MCEFLVWAWWCIFLGYLQVICRFLCLLLQLTHVFFHLVNLSNQAIEVSSDCRKEFTERSVNHLYFLLYADDPLLELHPKTLRAIFDLGILE